MQISKLLDTDRISCQQTSSSKKRALETLGGLLANATNEFTESEIVDSLINRERLGSTSLGKGVALPHGRMSGLTQPVSAIITLREGIDYDAVDRQPVDLLFALLVPEESTDEHLQILAQVAGLFSSKEFCTRLRRCTSSQQCLALISSWKPDQQLSA